MVHKRLPISAMPCPCGPQVHCLGMPNESRKHSSSSRCIVVLTLFAFSALAMPARAGDATREIVPELQAFAKLSDQTRLYLNGALTRNQTIDTTESELGAYLDFTLKPLLRPRLTAADWARDRYLWTRVGFAALNSPDDRGSGPTERRGIVEITARVPFPNEIWLVNRGRADIRDIKGESSQRYRYRLRIEREFTPNGVVTVPYAQVEAFYDTRFDTWNRRLYQLGAEIELTKQWRIEPYYARQNDTRPSTAHVDRIGLVLKYFH
jgi:hypothetical protein